MRRIDYDTEQHQDYARGRALTEQQLLAWISAFAAVLPERRPLAGLDVGSGTGRFTPRWRERSGRSLASSRRSACGM
jgi:ubiquinone/menaquinone biosynthesis C-methylase UbiE